MKKIDKKAFTLIELIVVIAILGVLVLLASPRFFGYTQNAELTKGFANARTIEKASELYYMDHEDWPRLTDEPYTSEEVESYSERIFNRTGQEVNLDPEGNYYDIDYDKLSDYIQVPDDKKNYILQNPVGTVYYMENLNEFGIARVDYSNVKEEDDNPIPIGEPIDFAYTGKPQNIELGKGTYKLEVWGAQGSGETGGKGGYSTGEIQLTSEQTLNVLVGGRNGYNGGGSGRQSQDAGGGGTDIRINGIALGDRVIVAGGGGGWGGRAERTGGHGGGTVGGDGAGVGSGNTLRQGGLGGTQTRGGTGGRGVSNGQSGSLGQGGSQTRGTTSSAGGGGGGGYYGGGAGGNDYPNYDDRDDGGGGGGSSYIGGVQDGKTIPGNQYMPNPNGGTMVGNSGHGFARITRIDYSIEKETENDNPIPIGEPINFAYTGKPQNIELGKGTYKLEVWGAQGGDGSSGLTKGGKGGYSTGFLKIDRNYLINVYVGGKGLTGRRTGGNIEGGWNGGGRARNETALNSQDYNPYHGSGGGASDIRLNGENLEDRIVVAGAGGGASGVIQDYKGHINNGGAGGGLIGVDGDSSEDGKRLGGTGGTQYSGGVAGVFIDRGKGGATDGDLGLGGSSGAISTNWMISGGGGGGYYGGAGGGPGGTGGGGGSSYIGGVQDGQTIAGDQSMPNPNGGTMVGNSGHGFVRITRVD